MITVRIPTETYAYVELQYDTIDDYAKNYPHDAAVIEETRIRAKKAKDETLPF